MFLHMTGVTSPSQLLFLSFRLSLTLLLSIFFVHYYGVSCEQSPIASSLEGPHKSNRPNTFRLDWQMTNGDWTLSKHLVLLVYIWVSCRMTPFVKSVVRQRHKLIDKQYAHEHAPERPRSHRISCKGTVNVYKQDKPKLSLASFLLKAYNDHNTLIHYNPISFLQLPYLKLFRSKRKRKKIPFPSRNAR